jgi:type II secretory pathway pseudopilin PulG
LRPIPVGHTVGVQSDWEPRGADYSRDDDSADLLEAGDELSFRPSRGVVAIVLLVVALVVGVPRALDWQAERRERAAVVAADKERRRLEAERAAAERAAEADRVSLDVVRLRPDVRPVPPDSGDDEASAEIELTFTVRNRAGAVTVHDVTFTPIGLQPIPVSHPASIAARGNVDLVATVRVPCDSVLDLNDDGAASLSLTATPASGRQQTIDSLLRNHPLPLTSDLRNSCGLQSPWEAAAVDAMFDEAKPDRLVFLVNVSNISRRPLVVQQFYTPGMSVTSSDKLPLQIAPDSLATVRVTLRVARCDALGLPVSGLTDDYDPLIRLDVTGVNHEPAQLVASLADRSPHYLAAKRRLLAKECPLQVRDS